MADIITAIIDFAAIYHRYLENECRPIYEYSLGGRYQVWSELEKEALYFSAYSKSASLQYIMRLYLRLPLMRNRREISEDNAGELIDFSWKVSWLRYYIVSTLCFFIY